jgi:hypothetical protein
MSGGVPLGDGVLLEDGKWDQVGFSSHSCEGPKTNVGYIFNGC